MNEYDYVVVGGGSAGAIVANRLSSDVSISVLLIEAGKRDLHPYTKLPSGFVKTIGNPDFDWMFQTEPEEYLNHRKLAFPRGKVLGGCSVINGTVHVRGNPSDFDQWARMGNAGWSYEEVLPSFLNLEKRISTIWPENKFWGSKGSLIISDAAHPSELHESFIRAAAQHGIPFNEDYNGAVQSGISYAQITSTGRLRSSASQAFLKPIMNRANLKVITDSMVSRIVLEKGRAIGVVVERGGKQHEIRATREVIVSAGAIGSPQLLQVSGIGDPALLREIGVDVVVANSHVGNHAKDHYQVRISNRIRAGFSLNEKTRGLSLAGQVMKYLFMGKGILTSGAAHMTAFTSLGGGELPDFQFFMIPLSYESSKSRQIEQEPGMSLAGWQQQPESKGYVRARSANISERPEIRFNYLKDPVDQRAVIAGIRLMRAIAHDSEFSNYFVKEVLPGTETESDEAILDYARNTGTSGYHPIGTCRMGCRDDAVVDAKLRVHGIQNLRVIDASVMPTMVSGNTNAATMMIAEHGSRLILNQKL